MPALVVATAATALTVFDGTVVTVALPQMQRELDLSLQAQGWVVQAYLLVPIGLLPVAGALADNVGRRRVFEIGVWTFAAASVLCALAGSAAPLLAGRALQGVGVGLLLPASIGVLTGAAGQHRQRTRAVMLWTSWSALATGAGPLLGGLVAGGPGWRWLFWLTVALAIPTALLARSRVPESRAPEPAPVAWGGAALAVLAAGGAAVGLSLLSSEGFSSPVVVGALATGIAASVLLAVQIARSRRPLVPPILFSHPSFQIGTLLTGIVYGGLFAILFFTSLYLQQALGLNAREAGLAMAPFAFGLVLAGPPAERVASTRGPRAPAALGCLLAGASMIAAAALTPTATALIATTAVAGIGLGIAAGPLMGAVIGSVERRRAAIATGVNAAGSRVAAIAAVAVLGIAGTAVFERDFERSSLPQSLERATESRIFAATRIVARSGAPEEAVSAAREATDEGFRAVLALTGAALLLGAAIAGLLGTPDPEHTGEMPVAIAPSPMAVALRRRYGGPSARRCNSRGPPGAEADRQREKPASGYIVRGYVHDRSGGQAQWPLRYRSSKHDR